MDLRSGPVPDPDFGDPVDVDHIKRHNDEVHTDIHPIGVVPAGPDLAGRLDPSGRGAPAGRPFGDGTPPGPALDAERVWADHTRLAVA